MIERQTFISDSEVSISTMFAFLFKKFSKILIAMCIGMVLCGGYKGYSELKNKLNPSDESETYEAKVLAWEIEHESLEQSVAKTSDKLETQIIYNNTAPLMSLNSTVVKTVVAFQIQCDNVKKGNLSQDSSFTYLENTIAKMYLDDWKSADIVNICGNVVKEESWLRELVFMDTVETVLAVTKDSLKNTLLTTEKDLQNALSNNGKTQTETANSFVCTVYSKTPEEGLAISTNIVAYIQAKALSFAGTNYEHSITIIQNKQNTVRGNVIVDYQNQQLSNVSTFSEDLKNAKNALKDHEHDYPESSAKAIIKWALVGIILGFFMGCLCLLISLLRLYPVTSSFEFEKKTGFIYLGSIFTKPAWNKKTTLSLLNERIFKSKEESVSYIKENVKVNAKDNMNILIASSCYSNISDDEVQFIIDAIKAADLNAVFAGNALTSPLFISELQKADAVILLEEPWTSTWQKIGSEIETIDRMGKKVIGFVFG